MNKNINLKPLLAESDLTEPSDILTVTQESKSATQHPQRAPRAAQPVTRTPHPGHCFAVDLGIINYNEAWMLQSELIAAKLNNSIDKDIILFLEHPAVFTLGRRGGREYLQVEDSFLVQAGVPIVQAERGGYITFHGPGQLVVYPIIDLEARRLGVMEYVAALEEIMLQTVRSWGLKAQRNSANHGIWMGNRKMGSIGIALRKGISFHGLALNINVDLTPFSWIQPCGLEGVSMTSAKQELGQEIPMDVVLQTVKKNFKSILELDLNDISYSDLQQRLRKGKMTQQSKSTVFIQKPAWLKRRLPTGPAFEKVKGMIGRDRLHTVCQEAKCPNIWECFSHKTATFLIMGSRCTRSCRFCSVPEGDLEPPDPQEPTRVAGVAKEMGLKYVVITSVTRDDLADGGAGIFAETIKEIRKYIPDACVEVLIPDFQGSKEALYRVLRARPDVLNHNIETVVRLYPRVRPQADYRRSLKLIQRAHEYDPDLPIKSGLMLGLGESAEEIKKTLEGMLQAGCRILTLGQYLQPSKNHLAVERFIPPEEFAAWRKKALKMGFAEVASGPFVRSSYHAQELFRTIKA